MNIRTTFALLLAIGFLLRNATTYAQENVQENRTDYWLNVGLGVSSLGYIAGNAGFSMEAGWGMLSLRGTENSEALFGDEFWDIGLLYGRALHSDRFFLSGGIGLGIVGGSRSDGLFSGRTGVPSVFGLPIELQAFWRFIPHVGIGLYGFADINTAESFAGLTLSLQVGTFREGE